MGTDHRLQGYHWLYDGLFHSGAHELFSELCNAHKHITMQQQKQYVRVDITISDNFYDCLFICKNLSS